MKSLEKLRKMTAETRSKWVVAERFLPSCPINEEFSDDILRQIESCLEMLAWAGCDRASLTATTHYMDVSPFCLSFNNGHYIVRMPDCFWKWWNAVDRDLLRCESNNPAFLEHKTRIHNLRTASAIAAIKNIMTQWNKMSDVPAIDAIPNGEEDAKLEYVFDWSTKK